MSRRVEWVVFLGRGKATRWDRCHDCGRYFKHGEEMYLLEVMDVDCGCWRGLRLCRRCLEEGVEVLKNALEG